MNNDEDNKNNFLNKVSSDFSEVSNSNETTRQQTGQAQINQDSQNVTDSIREEVNYLDFQGGDLSVEELNQQASTSPLTLPEVQSDGNNNFRDNNVSNISNLDENNVHKLKYSIQNPIVYDESFFSGQLVHYNYSESTSHITN